MDLPLIAKVLAISSSFSLGSYNFVFSQNVMPHIRRLPASTITPIFTNIYNVGATTILPVAATAITAYAYLAYTSQEPQKRNLYGVSAALMLSTLPWTQLVMGGGIKRLIEIGNSGAAAQAGKGVQEEVERLLLNWMKLNYFRSGLHFSAGVIGLVMALK